MKGLGRLCVITDTVIQEKYSHLEIAKFAIKGGADIIQFRDKNMSTADMLETAIEIRKLCNKKDVLFIVNDRADIALISGADGVHLGKEDISVQDARKLLGKGKIIGGTAHTLAEAILAEESGADYLGYGHIFETGTKFKSTKPRGLKSLKEVCSKISIPVFAIGGIGSVNASDVMNSGAYGIAVVGSVVKNPKPENVVKELKMLVYA